MIRTVMIGAGLVVLIARPTLGQDARIRGRLDRPTAMAVSAIIDSASHRGLPTEPLIQRALQGELKKATSSQIVAAVREFAGELGTARAALGPQSHHAELVAAASAIHAGITVADLHALRLAQPHRLLTLPLASLTDLVSHGVPAPRATETIRVALSKGASDAEIAALRRNVERDINAGAPPSAAAGVRAGGLPAKRSPGRPAAATEKRKHSPM